MKQRNKYDALIEDLTRLFMDIPNFNLTQEDESGHRLFLFVVKRISELQSFKILFINHYIKQSAQVMADDLKELKKSKYNQLIVLTQDEMHENTYETIRLGYVGLFHKYENFINDLIYQAELYLRNEWQISDPLQAYIKAKFHYGLKDWKRSSLIHRINWICNCVKHKDGFPVKPEKPTSLAHLPENERIKLNKDELKSDINRLEQHYILMLSLVLFIVLYRITFDIVPSNNAIEEEQQKLEQQIFEMITKLA